MPGLRNLVGSVSAAIGIGPAIVVSGPLQVDSGQGRGLERQALVVRSTGRDDVLRLPGIRPVQQRHTESSHVSAPAHAEGNRTLQRSDRVHAAVGRLEQTTVIRALSERCAEGVTRGRQRGGITLHLQYELAGRCSLVDRELTRFGAWFGMCQGRS
ncbi:hypothetical protein FHS42_000154 [Streptomyces zagrosensis]|uniref:Uncharacterized protein n=1 Tax=Streptomyces zagrosensis TaxID=1042984 RepID=A0A7W9UWB5_9ACTN|nr:hypothetical protein [Streptomyces zagrosensis]